MSSEAVEMVWEEEGGAGGGTGLRFCLGVCFDCCIGGTKISKNRRRSRPAVALLHFLANIGNKNRVNKIRRQWAWFFQPLWMWEG